MALNTWKARVKYEAIFFRVNVEEPLKFKENGEEDIVEVYVYHYAFVDRPTQSYTTVAWTKQSALKKFMNAL